MRRRPRRPWRVLAVAAALDVAALHGQECLGLPALSGARGSFAIEAMYAANTSVASVSLAGGRAGGAFARVQAGAQSFDDLYVEAAPAVGVTAGWEVARPSSAWSVCPLIAGVGEFGPHLGPVRQRTAGVGAGLHTAYRFDPLDPTTFVAYAGLSATRLAIRTEGAVVRHDARTVAGLEVGALFPTSWGPTIVPSLSVPIATRGAEVAAGVRLAWSFGARGAAP